MGPLAYRWSLELGRVPVQQNYVVVIWSSDALVADVMCYAMQRLGHPCRRIRTPDDLEQLLPDTDTRLIMVINPEIDHTLAMDLCADLRQRYDVTQVFLTDVAPTDAAHDLPAGAVTHPHPIELKQFHHLLSQIVQQ